MKIRKLLSVAAAALICGSALFANDLSFAIQADIQEGFKHETSFVEGFGTPAGRIIPSVKYSIPTPLGDNWLVSGATLDLGASLEITPVTAKLGGSVTWTPVPFLVFSAGADVGTGWTFMGTCGSGIITDYDDVDTTKPTETRDPLFYKAWAQGTFQFDTGAVIAGDWTHVLIQYTYQFYYQSNITVEDEEDSFAWQGKECFPLPKFYQSAILAYQLPLDCFYRIGAMWEYDGYYKYDIVSGETSSMSISPLASFRFSEKDNLNVLATIKFFDEYDNGPYLDRIAFSYTHNF